MPIWTQAQRLQNTQNLIKKRQNTLSSQGISDSNLDAFGRSVGKQAKANPVLQPVATPDMSAPSLVGPPRGQQSSTNLTTSPSVSGAPNFSETGDNRSYEEIGKSLANASYNMSDVEKQLYGDVKMPTSIDEYYKSIVESQKKDKANSEEQLKQQEEKNLIDAQDAQATLVANKAGINARFAVNPEGVVSRTGISTGNQLANAVQTKIGRLSASYDQAQNEIATAKQKLDEAEKQGRRDLVTQYQSELDAATAKAQSIDDERINTLTAQSQEDRAVQAQKNANFTTFTGLIDQGVELNTESIISMANSLGIPFENAYAYYQGAQQIRDDKTLDAQTKQAALDKAKQDLNDQITGMDTAAGAAIRGLTTLRQQGASEEAIAAYKAAAGITDYDDPFTRAKLQSQYLQNQITQYEADNLGKPPPEGSPEWLDYMSKKYELMQLKQQTSDMLGDTPLTKDTAEAIFQIPGQSKYRASGWECGEAYNKITDGPKVGDSYTSKLDAARDANGQLRQGMPQVGNGLVIPIGDAGVGHMETVISTNAVDGTFQTASWNRNLDGQLTVQTYDLADLQSGNKYGKNWGFTDSSLKPEYAQSLAQGAPSMGGDKYSFNAYMSQAQTMGLEGDDAKKWATDMAVQAYSGFKNTDQSSAYTAYGKMIPEENSYDSTVSSMSDQELEQFAKKNDYFASKLFSMNPDDKLTSVMINKYFTDPTQRQLVLQQMRWVNAKLRKESGAAISVGEYLTEGQEFWPQTGDDADTIRQKSEARKNYLNVLYNSMGPYGQRLIDESKASQGNSTQSLSENDLLDLYNNGSLESEEIDSIWNGTSQTMPSQSSSAQGSRAGGLGINF